MRHGSLCEDEIRLHAQKVFGREFADLMVSNVMSGACLKDHVSYLLICFYILLLCELIILSIFLILPSTYVLKYKVADINRTER